MRDKRVAVEVLCEMEGQMRCLWSLVVILVVVRINSRAVPKKTALVEVSQKSKVTHILKLYKSLIRHLKHSH